MAGLIPENKFTTLAYNQFLNEKKLMGSRCKKCGALYVPLTPICRKCYGDDMELVEMKGKGKLASYSVIAVGAPLMVEEGYDREHPYCTGIVELEEGVRIPARILGLDVTKPENIKIGTPLTVEFQERGEGEEKRTFLAFRV
jgi:hypothetical protein